MEKTEENQTQIGSGLESSACSPCREIGEIWNYYGGLSVKMEGGKCYWSIEDHDGHSWEEIPRSLFDALNKFQDDSEANIPSAGNPESPPSRGAD